MSTVREKMFTFQVKPEAGQTWYARMPYSSRLVHVEIMEVTPRTVSVREFRLGAGTEIYEREDVRLVERTDE